MTSTAKTPTEYLASIPEPRKQELKTLHELIRKLLPEFKPYMIAGMLGYGVMPQVYADGSVKDWCYVALANQKTGISLYICVVHPRSGAYLAETYKERLPKASIGKSCIRIKSLAQVDLKVIEALLKDVKQLAKQKPVLKATKKGKASK